MSSDVAPGWHPPLRRHPAPTVTVTTLDDGHIGVTITRPAPTWPAASTTQGQGGGGRGYPRAITEPNTNSTTTDDPDEPTA